MSRFLALCGVLTALATGCDPEPEPTMLDEGEEGVLRAEVDAGELDVGRIRVGLFEAESVGGYTTAEGQQTGTLRLRVLPEQGDGVAVWAFDGETVVDESQVLDAHIRPPLQVGIEDVESLEDFTLDLSDPYPRPLPQGEDTIPEDGLSATLIPLVWYDADDNGWLDFDFEGESETVRALMDLEGDHPVTLSHVHFEWVVLSTNPEAGDHNYGPQWTVWGTDTVVGRFIVSDWSTRWSGTLPSATEVRGR